LFDFNEDIVRYRWHRLCLQSHQNLQFHEEVAMLRKLIPFALGSLLIGSVALADTGDRKDLQVFNDVSKAVTRYTQFTIFDSVDAERRDPSREGDDECALLAGAGAVGEDQ